MEESYETFEEELGPPREDSPPQKPVQEVRRPEMYIKRKVTEEMAPVPRQPKAEARTLPREPSVPRTVSLHKALSIQNLSQTDKPWENVTLNRCLFVAITILVLTSGFQRLHETLRGQGTAEEEEVVELRVRKSGTLRHRGQPPEPEITLWEVMFWWLPDFDDEEDEDDDDDEEDKTVKSKKEATAHSPRGLRNKPQPGKKLTKLREEKLKDRRAKKNSADKLKDKKERDATEELDEAEEEERREKESAPKKNKRLEEQKKKKTPK